VDVLKPMLEDFQQEHGLSHATNTKQSGGETPIVRADFRKGSDFIRAYYVSDGSNVCLVTYLCQESSPLLQSELKEADLIVESLRF